MTEFENVDSEVIPRNQDRDQYHPSPPPSSPMANQPHRRCSIHAQVDERQTITVGLPLTRLRAPSLPSHPPDCPWHISSKLQLPGLNTIPSTPPSLDSSELAPPATLDIQTSSEDLLDSSRPHTPDLDWMYAGAAARDSVAPDDSESIATSSDSAHGRGLKRAANDLLTATGTQRKKPRKHIQTPTTDSQDQALEAAAERSQQYQEIIDAFDSVRDLLAEKEKDSGGEELMDVRLIIDEASIKLEAAITQEKPTVDTDDEELLGKARGRLAGVACHLTMAKLTFAFAGIHAVVTFCKDRFWIYNSFFKRSG